MLQAEEEAPRGRSPGVAGSQAAGRRRPLLLHIEHLLPNFHFSRSQLLLIDPCNSTVRIGVGSCWLQHAATRRCRRPACAAAMEAARYFKFAHCGAHYCAVTYILRVSPAWPTSRPTRWQFWSCPGCSRRATPKRQPASKGDLRDRSNQCRSTPVLPPPPLPLRRPAAAHHRLLHLHRHSLPHDPTALSVCAGRPRSTLRGREALRLLPASSTCTTCSTTMCACGPMTTGGGPWPQPTPWQHRCRACWTGRPGWGPLLCCSSRIVRGSTISSSSRSSLRSLTSSSNSRF